MSKKAQQTPEMQALTEILDFDLNESSMTLICGSEALDYFFDDAEKAIESFSSHSAEIVLTSILRKLNQMKLTNEVETLFDHVLSLVQSNDEANFA